MEMGINRRGRLRSLIMLSFLFKMYFSFCDSCCSLIREVEDNGLTVKSFSHLKMQGFAHKNV